MLKELAMEKMNLPGSNLMRSVFCFFSTAIAALCITQSTFAKDSGFVQEITSFPCKQAKEPIVIDGKLDEPSWKNAVFIKKFYDVQSVTPLPDDQVQAAFLYDKTNLYLGIIIKDRDIVFDPNHLNKGSETLFIEGDTLELFLQPDKNSPIYYEFHVNPNNVIWDAMMTAMAGYMPWIDNAKWNSGMKSAVDVRGTPNKLDEDEGWTVEIAIPLTKLTDKDGKPFTVEKGAKWRFSICLYDFSYYYDDCDNSSTLKYISSTKYPWINFHMRGYFNFIEFE